MTDYAATKCPRCGEHKFERATLCLACAADDQRKIQADLLAALKEIADMAHAGFCDCDYSVPLTNEKAHAVSCPVIIEATARAAIEKAEANR